MGRRNKGEALFGISTSTLTRNIYRLRERLVKLQVKDTFPTKHAVAEMLLPPDRLEKLRAVNGLANIWNDTAAPFNDRVDITLRWSDIGIASPHYSAFVLQEDKIGPLQQSVDMILPIVDRFDRVLKVIGWLSDNGKPAHIASYVPALAVLDVEVPSNLRQTPVPGDMLEQFRDVNATLVRAALAPSDVDFEYRGIHLTVTSLDRSSSVVFPL